MKSNATFITVKVDINADLDTVWERFTSPHFIVKWNFASDDWHAPAAYNDLRIGGKFNYRMEAKDGSFGFDFSGVYTAVVLNKEISYTMDDNRTATITFNHNAGITTVTETFEAETENAIELQQFGWQAILNNFKKVAES